MKTKALFLGGPANNQIIEVERDMDYFNIPEYTYFAHYDISNDKTVIDSGPNVKHVLYSKETFRTPGRSEFIIFIPVDENGLRRDTLSVNAFVLEHLIKNRFNEEEK